jgi:hypothetical protein
VPYFQDNLDDVLSFDGIRNFSGGQASGLQSDLLAENQVRELVNMTLSPKGNLETRTGATAFCTTATSEIGSIGGMRYYDTGLNEYLLTVTQGTFYSIDSNGSAEAHAPDQEWGSASVLWDNRSTEWEDGFSAAIDAPVSMAQFNDKMYAVDGDGDLHYFNGVTVTRQGAKLRAITVTSGGSGYTTATALVQYPGLTGTAPTITTTVAGGAVTAVIVVDGGSGYSRAPSVTIEGDGSGATATATVSTPPENLRILVNTGNRLFAVGSGVYRNTLYCSDILDASVWDSANSAVINGDDGDEITAIVPYYQNRIIVFKKRRVFQVTIPETMTSAADWTISLISNNTGCVAGNTAVQVSSDIFFLSDNGIRSLVRSAADDFSSIGIPISEVVKDVIQSINPAKIAISTAAFYDNRYFLAIPTGSNDYNDTMLVYNTALSAFEGTWTPQIMQFTLTNFDDQGLRLTGKSTTGLLLQYFGYKSPDALTSSDYADNGETYESSVRTKDFNFGDPFSLKYGSHFEVIFDDSYSTDATISIQRDIDVGDIDVQPNLNIASSVLTLDFQLPAVLPTSVKKKVASDLRKYEKWRLLNIKITSAAGKMAIRQITAASNPDTIEIQKSL